MYTQQNCNAMSHLRKFISLIPWHLEPCKTLIFGRLAFHIDSSTIMCILHNISDCTNGYTCILFTNKDATSVLTTFTLLSNDVSHLP